MDTQIDPPTNADSTKPPQAPVKGGASARVGGKRLATSDREERHWPNDAVVDLRAEWAPDEKTRHRILVENPVTPYGFAKASRGRQRRTG